MQSCDISPPPYITFNPQLSITGSVPVEMEGCEDARFKQRAVEFLTAENSPPIHIHRRMQAVFGDKCVDVSTVRCWVLQFKQEEVAEAILCDTPRSGRPLTATDELWELPT